MTREQNIIVNELGNTLVEMVLVLSFLVIVLFLAYGAFVHSAEKSLSVDERVIKTPQILDQVINPS